MSEMSDETESEWHERVYTGAPVVVAMVLGVAAFFMAVSVGHHGQSDHSSVQYERIEGLRLVVVETESCGWCQRFRRDVAPDYPLTPFGGVAPLSYVHLREVRNQGYRLKWGVRSVPTFLLLDPDGVEIDRVAGYPGRGTAFYDAMDRMLAKAGRGPLSTTR